MVRQGNETKHMRSREWKKQEQQQDKIEKELEDVVRHSKTRQGRDRMRDQERNRQDKAYKNIYDNTTSNTRQNEIKQDKTRQDWYGRINRRHEYVRQGKTDKTRQDKPRHDKARQGSTRQRQDRSRQD